MTDEQMVREFYEVVFNGHDIAATVKYMRPDYIQHNPGVGQGRAAFMEAFAEKFKAVPSFHLDVLRVVSQDDMVVVHLHAIGLPGKNEAMVCDIYRIEDGLLAEHWDVLMPIPEKMLGNPIYF
jgi:predicted SnoaL-like aldol condensation-catalyzing enzyme